METNRLNSMRGINVDSLIRYVFKLWMKSKKQILDEFNLTGPQFDILNAIYYLSKSNKEVIQINLSNETGIDPMSVSSILRNMEKNNIITRLRGRVNTRVIHVELTAKGISLFEKAYSKMSQSCNDLYRNIDEKNLTSQLIMLSNELNKLNKINN